MPGAGAKRSVEVEVAGQRLVIRSDQGAAYVRELASLVDAHLHELVGGRRGEGLQRALVLVAMQLADELLRERDLHRRLRDQVRERLAAIEEAFAEHQRHLAALAAAPAEHPGRGADDP
ncbi:MAG: cell division protein ZapA [Myxococcales bacterium]|nr:cell division protein ZapA [Myxococcales bacterium]